MSDLQTAASVAIQKAVAQHEGERLDTPALPFLEPKARQSVRTFIVNALRILADSAGVRHIPDQGKAGLVAVGAATLGWDVFVVEMDRPEKADREFAVVRADEQELRRRRGQKILKPEDFQ